MTAHRCPACESAFIKPRPYWRAWKSDPARQERVEPGPGEDADFDCEDCHWSFPGTVPEPTDEQMGYLGDGVFADNH